MILTFSRQVILSVNKHSWCQSAKMLHLPQAEEWKRISGDNKREKSKESKAKNNQGGVWVCLWECVWAVFPVFPSVQWRITHSNRFLWVDCQGTGFLSHICSRESRGERTRWRRVLTDWEQELPLSGAVCAKCRRVSSWCCCLIKSLTSDNKEIIW